VQALRAARLTAFQGEVHGLLGENGAGKTTLVRILSGFDHPDSGTVHVGGREVRFSNPGAAKRAGVGMVQQHFTLVPALTVLENIALGRRPTGAGLSLDLPGVRARAEELVRSTGLEVDLDARVADLSVGARQRVEILRVLDGDPSVLVLDEPTAVLAPPEVERLFGVIRGLADEGRTVLLIAHDLEEVLSLADRVTVLRGGETALEALRADVDAPGLARAMVGSDVAEIQERGRGTLGEIVASLEGVSARSPLGGEALRDVTLAVRRGEIVGVAGVEGNGQRELARVLSGLDAPVTGRATVPPAAGWIPQDRTHEGLVPALSLTQNLALAEIAPGAHTGTRLDWGALTRRTREVLGRFDVRSDGPKQRAGQLSGGNQQKVVVAREMERSQDLLVAENPTRGLDVAAGRFVHRELIRLRDRGEAAPGIVLISTDLDEVLTLADRLFVLRRGRLLGVSPELATREGVGRLMLGAREEVD
jgi:simple sugar transport system ATP-binding protein